MKIIQGHYSMMIFPLRMTVMLHYLQKEMDKSVSIHPTTQEVESIDKEFKDSGWIKHNTKTKETLNACAISIYTHFNDQTMIISH